MAIIRIFTARNDGDSRTRLIAVQVPKQIRNIKSAGMKVSIPQDWDTPNIAMMILPSHIPCAIFYTSRQALPARKVPAKTTEFPPSPVLIQAPKPNLLNSTPATVWLHTNYLLRLTRLPHLTPCITGQHAFSDSNVISSGVSTLGAYPFTQLQQPLYSFRKEHPFRLLPLR